MYLAFWDVVFSAWRMIFVKMMFAVCMSGGGRMSEKATSVSVVNCVQFCFPIVRECVSVLL